jgi:hypothetical protein
MNSVIALVGLLILILFYVAIALAQKRIIQGFVSEFASATGETHILTSQIPDLCSDFNETDCNRTKSCEFSRDAGMCVRLGHVGNANTQATLKRDIIQSMTDSMFSSPGFVLSSN